MNTHRRILSFVGIALIFATVSFAQQVKTDYDRNADFSQYKTYSWEKVHTQNPLWVDRIKAAVNSALAAKGYYDSFGGGWGWRSGFGGGFGDATTTEDTYKVGTLVVDLFDSNTKKLVWRGSASDTVSDKSDKNIKNLDKGVEKMFDHLPPATR
jgi:hypothetical protein